MHINIGRWTEKELDRLILKAAEIDDPGERVAFISGQFLGTAYQENTLIGDQHTAEELVIDLSGLDCFTFLDYVEAMRLSRAFSDFQDRLKQVRYRGDLISYRARNHFFTDWTEYRSAFVRDATKEIGMGKAKKVQKTLNRKDDKTLFLHGVAPVDRTITYIPTDEIDAPMLQNLKTGDYAGIYSEKTGLDVSHVGIVIRKGTSILLRHAASAKELRKITDQDLQEYISNKPGLIILRPTVA